MIDDLRAMAVFAKTVEMGSFRAAAKELQLSSSVVSHHVSQLESRLGVALLYRSTRQLSLTHHGAQLFESVKAMLAAAETGLNAMARQSQEPSGTLRITVPAFFSRGTLLEDIAAFAQAFPKVLLSINFSDVKQDLIQEGIDLAIRIGQLQDSALKSKKLFDVRRKLVVAPHYRSGRAVEAPQDLAQWDWIGLSMRPDFKTLSNAAGETCKIEYQPRISVDSIDAVCQLAIAGLGLATPPAFMVEDAIAAGRLIDPLPGWQVEALGAYAVWPANAARESLTLRLIRFLEMREIQRSS